MPELIRNGENGFFVERDAVDIAEKLRWLRDDPGLRVRLGRAARRAAELWDWRHQAPNYDAMLRAVLGERQIAAKPS
jgi:glycosyltransferase involved in cell wall biosynthesis